MSLVVMAAESAQTVSDVLGPFSQFLDFGLLAVVLGLAYTRKIRFEGEVQEKDKQIAELKDSLNKYIEHYQREVLPALLDATKVSGEVVAVLNRNRD